MKKNKLLKVLALGASVLTLATGTGLTACSPAKRDEKPYVPPVVDPVDPVDPIDPVDPNPNEKTEEEKLLEENVEKAKNFFERINNNLTISKTEDSSVSTYKFQNSKAEIGIDGDTKFYDYSSNKSCFFEKKSDGYWYKYNCQENVFSEITELVGQFNRTSWTSFDSTNDQLVAEADGKKTTMKLENNQATFVVRTGDESSQITVSKIGSTRVSLPTLYYDKTDETPVPVDPVEDEEKIYNIVNGQKVINVPVFAKAIEEFFAENPSYYKNMMINRNYTLNKVLFVNQTNNGIEIGVSCKEDNTPIYHSLKIADANLSDVLSSKCETKGKFKKYIKENSETNYGLSNKVITQNVSPVSYEYDILNGTSQQKSEFNAMTRNINEKLGLNMSDVYFGFKTGKDGGHASSQLGNFVNWKQYFVAKCGNQIKLIDVVVSSSTWFEGEINNIVNNSEYWGCALGDEKTLNSENSKLYNMSRSLLNNANLSKEF